MSLRPVELPPADWGHWFAGFVDGEGCFGAYIQAAGHGDTAHFDFTIRLREDDYAILETIRDMLGGIGRLSRQRCARGGNPVAQWKVSNPGECMLLVRVFEVYPLRAKKARDFDLWRQGVREEARGHMVSNRVAMRRIVEAIQNVRAFGAGEDGETMDAPQATQSAMFADVS